MDTKTIFNEIITPYEAQSLISMLNRIDIKEFGSKEYPI